MIFLTFLQSFDFIYVILHVVYLIGLWKVKKQFSDLYSFQSSSVCINSLRVTDPIKKKVVKLYVVEHDSNCRASMFFFFEKI